MFSYYCQLGWKSLRQTPVMSALMIAAIAVGVAVTMSTLTLQHVMSRNPLAERDDRLYYVQLDSWDPKEAYAGGVGNAMPDLLTWMDAQALLRSDIPARSVAMYSWGAALMPQDSQLAPMQVGIRVTTRDYFGLFGLQFLAGGTWEKTADEDSQFLTVINRTLSEKLFGTTDVVGRTVDMNGHAFTITGVVEDWFPAPTVQDLSTGAFKDPDQVYIPMGLAPALQIAPWGNTNCWDSNDNIDAYDDFLRSGCVFVLFWVELPDADAVARYSRFLEAHINEQKAQGRFARPLKYALSRPSEWLEINNVVGNDNKLLTVLSFAFLLVCVANTVALLLAKFLRKAPEAGVRRALGASRGAIVVQHLVESALVGAGGGLLGLALAQLGLVGVRAQVGDSIARVLHMDTTMVVVAIALAFGASLLAGLYPAWRIGQTNPAYYLKTQ
jgi:putative ABC transport system permease protein